MGNLSFPYEEFEIALAWATNIRDLLGVNTYTPLKTGSTKFMQFSVVRGELRSSKTDIPLFRLAARYGRLLATDPRDKIYAFLSLSPQLIQEGKLVKQDFIVDYGRSTLEVYRDFALFCIKKYNNPEILSHPFRNCEEHPLDLENWPDDWPSWVPDWDRRGIKENDFGDRDSLEVTFREFHASAGWDGVEFVEMDRRTIGFAGELFDEIAVVVDGDIFRDPAGVDRAETEWGAWEGFAISMGDTYGEKAEDKEEAFWRILVAGSDGKGSFAPQEFGKMFRCWRTNTPPSDVEEALYKSFTHQLFRTTRGRKLFLTKRGYLGISHCWIEEGDSISILRGGKLPILGRASGAAVMASEEDADEVAAELVPIYRLVGGGGTYVHGIMDGEAVGILKKEGGTRGGVFFC
jgi:hypothetical protein